MAEEILQVKRNGDFYYPIYFEEGFDRLADAICTEGLEGRNLCIVTDTHVEPLYAEKVKRVLTQVASRVSVFVFEAGERNKNLNTVQQLYKALIENQLDRKSLVVALGGGVVGDLSGFGAATYLRGIDFIQIPTTLLSQVDSSVGGKTGVDLDQYKNMVGAFHQPRLVYMNMNTLKSLPPVEFACGMGEVLKTGLICDADFYEYVLANHEAIRALDTAALAKMIRRCCEIKAGVVERDPKEQGERALLNFGHTLGHAIEKLKNFELLHGECVAIGMVAASYLSYLRNMITEAQYRTICEMIQQMQLPTTVEGLTKEDIIRVSKNDKKMNAGQIRFILLDDLGNAVMTDDVTDEELSQALDAVITA